MSDFDYSGLDGASLRTFLVVLEELSVSRAAERLNVSQSAVSHTLARLRDTLGDPLFVRAGRGIAATEQARALRDPVRDVLDHLKQLTHRRSFDPTAQPLRFVVAANDFQRDLMFPSLWREADAAGVTLHLRFMPSGIPGPALLREARCDLMVTPYPPEGTDILQVRLFEDSLACFYDGSVREPPRDWDDFRSSRHIEVRFAENTTSLVTLSDVATTSIDNPSISVPNFSALAAFMRGTDLLATELALMSLGPMRGLDYAPLPFPTRKLPMYLAWHRRDHDDPAHRWMREQVKASAAHALRDTPLAATAVRPTTNRTNKRT
ncbi:MAG: LysR family transcriptional regulator [Pseudomonadota bacterium]